MPRAPRARRGFSIIEALVSAVLLGVGIVAAMSALGAMAKGESRIRDIERFTTLARSKYDELLLEDPNAASGDENGDFADQGQPDVEWTWSRSASGTESLDIVRLTVKARGAEEGAAQAILSGLSYRPAQTSTLGAAEQ